MSASTFTTVATFEEVLFGEASIAFRREVIIAFFKWDNFLHILQR